MTPFLYKVASYIFENYNPDYSRICIVLPSRRAALFLKKYLAKMINEVVWAPDIYSIEDFIEEQSGVVMLDRITLIFELYQVHKEIEKSESQSFDEFYKWGHQLIADFNDVDLYMVDHQKLYQYLDETRALSVWNLNSVPLTDREKYYLRFYNSLSEYYERFKKRLNSKGHAFQGMAYRLLANSIEERSREMKWEKIIFAGFNALTASEEYIIKHLKYNGIAETLWDGDSYYIDDKKQEAGKFLSYHLKKNNNDDFKWIENNLINSKKKINVTGVPKNIGQVKLLGQILDRITENDSDLENTAVVLADENLLIPVLHSIPEKIRSFNITMGLPLRFTPVYDLLNTLFSIYEYAEEFSQVRKSDQALYYHKLIEKLLKNFYIRELLDNENIHGTTPENDIGSILKMQNKAFYTSKDFEIEKLDERSGKFFDKIFPVYLPDPSAMIDLLGWLFDDIRDMLVNNRIKAEKDGDLKQISVTEIQLEYLYSFSILLKRIKSLHREYKVFKNLRILSGVFRQMIKQTSVPFYGEPLKGLQVMGMLETRTLDFKNLVILSVNENILPAAKSMNSYIPHEIRREFNLPTYKDKDSIFAYHFYRLLQRCEEAHLIYNTESDELKAGEQSRFIKQIIRELPKVNPNVEIKESIMEIPYKEIRETSISIEKDDEVFDILMSKAESGFSPSALNKYIRCSLSFYFQEILGLREKEEVEDEIDFKTYGKAIHDTLEVLYSPCLDRKLEVIDIKEMDENAEAILREKFSENYKGSDLSFGKNLLTVKTAEISLKDFLKREMSEVSKNEIIVKKVEEWFNSEMEVPDTNIPGNTFNVKLKGKADRIDSFNKVIRIIDYKTGRVEDSGLKVNEFQELIKDVKYEYVFQLLMYSYLFKKNNENSSQDLTAGILSFKDLKKGLKKVSFEKDYIIGNKMLQDFSVLLKQLLTEIFDRSKLFEQTEDSDNCRYCPYINICNRWKPNS